MVNPLTPEQETEALFIMAMLEDQFGGLPSVGVDESMKYIVVATCKCPSCVEFNSTYKPRPKDSLLAAAKAYGDDRICFLETLEAKEQKWMVH